MEWNSIYREATAVITASSNSEEEDRKPAARETTSKEESSCFLDDTSFQDVQNVDACSKKKVACLPRNNSACSLKLADALPPSPPPVKAPPHDFSLDDPFIKPVDPGLDVPAKQPVLWEIKDSSTTDYNQGVESRSLVVPPCQSTESVVTRQDLKMPPAASVSASTENTKNELFDTLAYKLISSPSPMINDAFNQMNSPPGNQTSTQTCLTKTTNEKATLSNKRSKPNSQGPIFPVKKMRKSISQRPFILCSAFDFFYQEQTGRQYKPRRSWLSIDLLTFKKWNEMPAQVKQFYEELAKNKMQRETESQVGSRSQLLATKNESFENNNRAFDNDRLSVVTKTPSNNTALAPPPLDPIDQAIYDLFKGNSLAEIESDDKDTLKEMEDCLEAESDKFLSEAQCFVERVQQVYCSIMQDYRSSVTKESSPSDNASLQDLKLVPPGNLVPLAQLLFQTQALFRLAGTPASIDLGYHYTKSEYMDRIRQYGLLTKPERDVVGISSKFNGAVRGHGIYTSDSPYRYARSYGDTGLIVARLKGFAFKGGRRRKFGVKDGQDGFDTITSPRHVVLKQSSQCLALVEFPACFVQKRGSARGNRIVRTFHVELQKIVDGMFNKEVTTPRSSIKNGLGRLDSIFARSNLTTATATATATAGSDSSTRRSDDVITNTSAESGSGDILTKQQTAMPEGIYVATPSTIRCKDQHSGLIYEGPAPLKETRNSIVRPVEIAATKAEAGGVAATILPPAARQERLNMADPNGHRPGTNRCKSRPPIVCGSVSLQDTHSSVAEIGGGTATILEPSSRQEKLNVADPNAQVPTTCTNHNAPQVHLPLGSVVQLPLQNSQVRGGESFPSRVQRKDQRQPRNSIEARRRAKALFRIQYEAPDLLHDASNLTHLFEKVQSPFAEKECPICFLPLDSLLSVSKLRGCGHEFCGACIEMSLQNTSRMCPICRAVINKPQGKMPTGSMVVYQDSTRGCNGASGNLRIVYAMSGGTQKKYHENPGVLYGSTRRTAYLPDDKQGRDLLKRLKYAFECGLTFSVGRSLTTNRENCITWSSIHHKTRLRGGTHGFPDDNYFQNCNEELSALGVPKAEDL